jgi:glycerophosphoryl diester phosphodiesterase
MSEANQTGRFSVNPQGGLPELIALRGNVAEYPENTLPALRSALELGSQFVEFDVQLSADHQPFLLHDADLKRTAGVERSALEMIWSELAEVRVNEADRLHGRYDDVSIPSLAQTASLLATFPSATAFIEIKRSSLRKFGPDLVINRIAAILKPIARQCVVVSADLPAIHHLRQLSALRVGWILQDYSTLSALKCEALAPEFVFCNRALLPDNAARLWRGPWRWAIYETAMRKEAVDLGARGAALIGTLSIRSLLREFRGIKAPSRP